MNVWLELERVDVELERLGLWRVQLLEMLEFEEQQRSELAAEYAWQDR